MCCKDKLTSGCEDKSPFKQEKTVDIGYLVFNLLPGENNFFNLTYPFDYTFSVVNRINVSKSNISYSVNNASYAAYTSTVPVVAANSLLKLRMFTNTSDGVVTIKISKA